MAVALHSWEKCQHVQHVQTKADLSKWLCLSTRMKVEAGGN